VAHGQRPDDDPASLGRALRRARREAGVSLDEIVAETKVSRRIYEALEAGRYQFLPEKVFCKNFLRQYSELVGEEARRLTQGFDAAWESYQRTSGSFAILKVEEPPKAYTRWWLWLPFILAAIVVVTLVVISIRGRDSGDPLPPDPRRSSADRPSAPDPASTPTPAFDVSEDPLPVDPPEQIADEVRAVLRVGHGKECWVHYRDRNGQIGEALLSGGERFNLDLPGPVLLTIGNADAAAIEVGGRTFADLGDPGEVVRFVVSSTGLQPFSGDLGNG
jgi:hypothetical protein